MKTKNYLLLSILLLISTLQIQAGRFGRVVSENKWANVPVGWAEISYTGYEGAVWVSGTNNTTVQNYIRNKLGARKQITYKTKIYNGIDSGDGTGKVRYYVVQLYENKSYTSGSARFEARIYKGAYIRVGHGLSGGSGGGSSRAIKEY